MKEGVNKVILKDQDEKALLTYKEMAEDLKKVFDNFDSTATIENALGKTKKLCEKWKARYPHLDRFFKDATIEYYFTYLRFNPHIRRMIYTTNSIENLNRAIRKATKNKLSFETPDSLLDYVFMITKEFEEKNFMKYPITNYKYLIETNAGHN
jgi:transposase-like protein